MLFQSFFCIILNGFLLLSETATPPNVLMIVSEDMRPELPAYGNIDVITPNLDRLQKKSVTFDLTLSQVSICAPSRASLLTGLRPDTLGIYDFGHYGGLRFLRTIPSHLHSHGYQTAMSGKLHHWESSKHYSRFYYGHPDWENIQSQEMKYHNSSVTPDQLHEAQEDSKPFFRDKFITNHAISFLQKLHKESQIDVNVKNNKKTSKGNSKKGGSPWFLGVGFKGSHMQYQMPLRFWEAYKNHTFPLDNEETNKDGRTSFSYHESLTFPKGAVNAGLVKSAESRYIMYMKNNGKSSGTDREPYQKAGSGRSISTRGWEELYRGYLATISYMDSQLGRILNELDDLKLWENTIVIFTSDHGMHVGEKGMWSKWSLFDESSRVPLFIHDPRSPGSYGQHYKHPVELLDIFPTLVDMTNTYVDTKNCKDQHKVRSSATEMEMRTFRHQYCDPLDGISLKPLFDDLQSKSKDGQNGVIESNFRREFDFALTQKQSCKSISVLKRLKMRPSSASVGFFGNVKTQIDKINNKMINSETEGWIDFCPFRAAPNERSPMYGMMGYSMRTVDWRYTSWLLLDVNTLLPALDIAPLAEELYDHRTLAIQTVQYVSGKKEIRSVVGRKELVNLVNSTAENGLYQNVRARLRRKLYDYLYYNVSHAHVFQGRVQEQVDFLQEINLSLGKGSSAKEILKRKDSWTNVIANRAHEVHPHWRLHGKHFYE
jgi:iduronate 2-sulfatase